MFHNLKNNDADLSLQNFEIFDFKIKVIPNRLEKHMSFSLDNKLVYNDSFHFLNSLLNSLVKKLAKND